MISEERLLKLWIRAPYYTGNFPREYARAVEAEATAELRARVRELEAERSAMIDNVRFARERAERAESENEALAKKLAGLEQYRSRDQLVQRVLHSEAERDALRALLRRVLSCGLNEEPHGIGFTPSRQERVASELARDINAALKEKP